MISLKQVITYMIVLLFITGCSNNSTIEFNRNYKLNLDDFHSMLVTVNGVKVIETSDKSLIEKIIKEINTNERQFATEMAFEKGPEGLITLKGEREVEISFFKDTGRTIYGEYYIHTEFHFD